jgi:hypothetical protein
MMERKHERKTRRRFLKTALAGLTAAGVSNRPAAAKASSAERERLERLVSAYGSELGDVRRTGEGS